MTTRTARRSSNIRSGTGQYTRVRRSSRRIKRGVQDELCTCGEDRADSPMLKCGVCYRWFHFQCVNLAEREAEDLAYYVCPACNIATGKMSRELWELDDDEIPEILVEDAPIGEPRFPHSSDDEGSEDNFVHDNNVPALDDSSAASEDETIGARTHRLGARKRRSISKYQETSIKRRKPEAPTKAISDSSPEDPIRKSCLKILVNLLTPIFSERLPEESDPTIVSENAESFATSLEACVFDIYSELDDFGEKLPSNKYKDRVRMLNFNLGKKDRQELRRSIRIGQITPDELSRMSSIDLANAHAQQEAQKLAEEAMNHSILQARTAPLRKITHKGEEMIEKNADEDSWRIQEEDRERERERERQRSRVGSLSESIGPTAATTSSFRRPSIDFTSTSPQADSSTIRAFDPASTVFGIDFDGDGPNTLSNGPSTPPELSGAIMDIDNNALDNSSPGNPAFSSTSPTTQNFSLDGLFGNSEPMHESWPENPDAEGSVGGRSATAEDLMPDDTDFDAFITVDEDEAGSTRAEVSTDELEQSTAHTISTDRIPSLADLPSIWRGHLGMPSVTDPTRMIQFQSEFKQIGGSPFNDTAENRHALFPASLFEIIGRVPTSHAIKYLVSMRLNPTKELFAVALVPNEADKSAYTELHKLLIEKDRYGLVFPWGQDPQLSAPGKELYIAPLLPEHPIPEYLELLDDVKIPEKRDSPIFCGIFVLNKGRVTSLNSVVHSSHSMPTISIPVHLSSGIGPVEPSPPMPHPGPPEGLPGIPSSLAPVISSSLSNLSESTLATLTQDLANLNPTQLELVRSLLLPQALPIAAQQNLLTPAQASTANINALPHPPAPPASSGSASSGQSPSQHTPASWDRPASYSLESNWIPGPGYYARAESREDRSHNHWSDNHRGDNWGDTRVTRNRGAGHSGYRGRGTRGGGRW